MARLIFCYNAHGLPQETVSMYPSEPAEQCLGKAINKLAQDASQRLVELTNGSIPDVPDIISQKAREKLTKLEHERFPFTVFQLENGFAIYGSPDAIECHILIND